MNASLFLTLALCVMPTGEIKTIIAVEADIVFRESLPSLPDDLGDKKPKGQAVSDVDQNLPELWYWSHAGCAPCKLFESDYANNKESALFKPVIQTGERPKWMPDKSPQFWWHISGKSPTQADIANTRHQNGYAGWKDLKGKFDNSRTPKQFKRSSSTFQDGQSGASVQPDNKQSRAVARSGHASYHAGHNCPGCAREQYNIQDDDGPGSNTHIHKCSSCGTSWYHADQWQSSGSRKTKSFLGITWQ